MLDVHTPVLIKYWYCLVVMMIFYSLPTLECIDGSTCSDRELVNNEDIKEKITNYSNEGQMEKIRCLDTSEITNMGYLFEDDYYGSSTDFNADLSCWNISSVTSMKVSTWSLEYHVFYYLYYLRISISRYLSLFDSHIFLYLSKLLEHVWICIIIQ